MSTVPADAGEIGTEEQAAATFLGHPRGLAFLAFTEMWERFSYYGMGALVVLYMAQHLLLPGQIEQVAGMAAWRGLLEGLFGPLSPQALASQTFGFYSAFVYFTPLLGGLVADRWLGANRTVVIGALLMSAGHFAMAFEQSFLIALVLLVTGSGCLKGNISAQVGHLYPPADESRRTRAFTLFSTAINVGAVLGPLVCGLLAQFYGWPAGFGAAGVMMAVATGIYLAGQRHLPDRRPSRRNRETAVPLDAADRRTILVLLAVLLVTVFQTIAYFQIWNVGLVWIDAHVDLDTRLGPVPASWFNSVESFASIVAMAPLVALWARQARNGREPDDIGKIGRGAMLAAAAAGVLALGSALAGDGKVPIYVPLVGWAGMGVAFLHYWPPLLALFSRAAPPAVNSTMMGVAFLSLFAGSLVMGWVGTLYETMTPAQFWALDGGIAATGALIVLAVGRPLSRALRAG